LVSEKYIMRWCYDKIYGFDTYKNVTHDYVTHYNSILIHYVCRYVLSEQNTFE